MRNENRLSLSLGRRIGTVINWTDAILYDGLAVKTKAAIARALQHAASLREFAESLAGPHQEAALASIVRDLDEFQAQATGDQTVESVARALRVVAERIEGTCLDMIEAAPPAMSRRRESQFDAPQQPVSLILMDIYDSAGHRRRANGRPGVKRWDQMTDELFGRIWERCASVANLYFGKNEGDLEAWVVPGGVPAVVSARRIAERAISEAYHFSREHAERLRSEDGIHHPVYLKLLVGHGHLGGRSGNIAGPLADQLFLLERCRLRCRPSSILLTDSARRALALDLHGAAQTFIPFQSHKTGTVELSLIRMNPGPERRDEVRTIPQRQIELEAPDLGASYALYDESPTAFALYTDTPPRHDVDAGTTLTLHARTPSQPLPATVRWSRRGGQLLGLEKSDPDRWPGMLCAV